MEKLAEHMMKLEATKMDGVTSQKRRSALSLRRAASEPLTKATAAAVVPDSLKLATHL